MGVHGLWQLLEPSGRRLNVELLTGKILAVDASIWITQFIKAMRDDRGEMIKNAHLLGFFRRICKMLFHKIKPVFVFDGGTPALKKRTVAERRRRREVQEAKLKRVAEKLLLNHLKKQRSAALALSRHTSEACKGSSMHSGKGEKLETMEPENNLHPMKVDKGKQAVASDLSCDEIDAEHAETTPSGMDGDHLEDESVVLPDNIADMDAQALSALPPSMQFDVLLKMREKQNIANREQYTLAQDPSDFSSMQISAYLKSTQFKQKIEDIRGVINAEAQPDQSSAGKPIMTEAGREYILQTAPKVPAKRSPSKRKKSIEDTYAEQNPKKRALLSPTDVPPWLQQVKRTPFHDAPKDVDGNTIDYDTGGSRPFIEGAALCESAVEIDLDASKEDTAAIDDLFGEAFEDDGLDDSPSEKPQLQVPSNWRERAATRQKFWSLAHGFKMGRKLSEWAVQEEEQTVDDEDEDKELELALKLSLQDKQHTNTMIDAADDEGFEWQDADTVLSQDQEKLPPSTQFNALVPGRFEHAVGHPSTSKEMENGSKPSRQSQNSQQSQEVHTGQSAMLASHKSQVLPAPINVDVGLKENGVNEGSVMSVTKDELEGSIKRDSPSQPPGGNFRGTSIGNVPCQASAVRRIPEDEETPSTSAPLTQVNDSERLVSRHGAPLPDIRDVPSVAGKEEETAPALSGEFDDMEKGEFKDAKRAAGIASETPTKDMFQDVMQLLAIFGIPYIIAPMEAEAQCAWLNEQGLVDGVVTDDSDVFLFGGQCVYRNMFEERKYVEEYQASIIHKELGLDREKLIHLALLLGSDYTEGITGVGIVNAIEIVHAFPGLDGLYDFREWVETPDLEGFLPGVQRVLHTDVQRSFHRKHGGLRRNWEVHPSFPSESVVQAYTHPHVEQGRERFRWGPPDEALLMRFCLHQLGMEPNQAQAQLGPVLASQRESYVQTRLDAFYSFKERFAQIRSKRIREAVAGITRDRSPDKAREEEDPLGSPSNG